MFSGNAAQITDAAYIEDVFSTWLYTGNGSTQTITNGIDLAGKGGLVWMKGRSTISLHGLYDTARGATFEIGSDSTAAQTTQAQGLTSFLANGFSIGSRSNINTNGATQVSWTFRKQPKFFDIVTYTGNATARTIPHNLGSVPGCIITKKLNDVNGWFTYHRSYGALYKFELNEINNFSLAGDLWNNTEPTSTVFSLGATSSANQNGSTYVAYLFAHDAGGFGATGADNVISCASYTGNGSTTGPVVTLGYEPQWLLIKNGSTSANWNLIDNMRGFTVGGTDAELNPNLSNAESTGTLVTPTATGFQLNTIAADYNTDGETYIYISIRRGPMRTPTSGTSVFQPFSLSSTSTDTLYTTGFPVDMAIAGQKNSNNASDNWTFVDRLRGMTANSNSDGAASRALLSTSTAAEAAQSFPDFYNVWNTGLRQGQGLSGASTSYQFFRRAPGFFDVVCYTGTGVARAVNHNLGVPPELMIVKSRNGAGTSWPVYTAATGPTQALFLNAANASAVNTTAWNSTAPTASVFSLGTFNVVNNASNTYVAYLFASCPGVSKVGSYTGTGATQTINCGFAAGARFVLIKRTDSTGDWYVWDSARGIVAGNDPYLLLNSTAAEVTNTDWVDTAASGFELSNAGGNSVNISGASYIFLSVS
jgi:hypothetical protein